MIGSVVDCLPANRQFKKGLPVAFLKMDNTKAMDLLISRFLLDKHVVNGEPSVERNTMFDAKVDDVGYEMEDVLRSGCVGRPVLILLRVGKCLHVAEMATRWGDACCLTPMLKDLTEVVGRDGCIVIRAPPSGVSQ